MFSNRENDITLGLKPPCSSLSLNLTISVLRSWVAFLISRAHLWQQISWVQRLRDWIRIANLFRSPSHRRQPLINVVIERRIFLRRTALLFLFPLRVAGCPRDGLALLLSEASYLISLTLDELRNPIRTTRSMSKKSCRSNQRQPYFYRPSCFRKSSSKAVWSGVLSEWNHC